MSLPTITVSFSNPDPNATVSSVQDLVTLLNTLAVGEIAGTFVPYILSDSTPATSDQDKLWARTDTAGRPIGLFKYYNGNWRRFPTGKAWGLELFKGDPAIYFDGTGLGLIGGDWDGYAICNGNNGTENLSDLFPVFGRMDNTGITGWVDGWKTNVTGTAEYSAGQSIYNLSNNNLPNMKVQLSGRVGYDDNGSGAPADAIVTTKGYGGRSSVDIASFGSDTDTGNPQVAVPTVPPFKAMAICQWVGY